MNCDSGASRADEFQGGTSAGGVTGDVTSSELAEISQQSHVSVTGCNILPEASAIPDRMRPCEGGG